MFKLFNALLICAIAFLITGVSVVGATSNDYAKDTYYIKFPNENMPIEKLEELSSEMNLKEFQIEFILKGETITVGYKLGESYKVDEAKRKILSQTRDAIKNQTLNLNNKQRELLKNKLNNGNVFLSKVLVQGDFDQIKNKFPNNILKEIKRNKEVSKETNTISTLSHDPGSLSKVTSTPYRGESNLFTSSGNKYIQQEFTFNYNGLYYYRIHDDVSFELDSVLYNYDGSAWATDYAAGSGTWYASNLPNPYLDTNFGDDWDFYGGGTNAYGEASEEIFSVGTFDAGTLDAGQNYYYTVEVTGTSRSENPYLKLIAQPGSYSYESTWWVFAQASHIVKPFTNIQANRSYPWYR